MESNNLDPWKRANLETFNIETLGLIPDGSQPDYSRIMKELAHAKAIAALALERVYLSEQERAAFFEPFIERVKGQREDLHLFPVSPESNRPGATRSQPDVAQPNYRPVTDLTEYRNRHV